MRIIGGHFRCRRLHCSGDLRTRPMKDRLREAIFNLIGPSIRGAHAIDLFAGTGALALEALSRGADYATLIEQHNPTANVIRRNVAELDVADRAEVVVGNVFIWWKRQEKACHQTISRLPSGKGQSKTSPLPLGEGPGVRASDASIRANCKLQIANCKLSTSNPQSLIPNRSSASPHLNPLPTGEATGNKPWAVFCSPPYDFYVQRVDEMLDLIAGLIQAAPDGSIFIVEADARFDFARLGDPQAWNVRSYPPAVVGIFRKE
jgi:16S rRNA G966 N2-methylase RsmD